MRFVRYALRCVLKALTDTFVGVNVVSTPHPDVTHHLTPAFAITPAMSASLLSAAQFVKSEWLSEVIRLGDLPANNNPATGTSLEQAFALPLTIKFRPAFSAALPASAKAFKTWEPNEERLNMLRGHRFLFVGEKGHEVDGDMRELVVRGQGEWEGFSVQAGRVKWHQVLAKGHERVSKPGMKGLVVVADGKAMEAAVGRAEWQEIVDETKR